MFILSIRYLNSHFSPKKKIYIYRYIYIVFSIGRSFSLSRRPCPSSLSLSLSLLALNLNHSLSPNFCLEQYSRSSFSHTLSVWTQPTTQPNPHAHRCQMPKPRQGSLFFISSTNPKEEVNSTPCLQLNHDFIT